MSRKSYSDDNYLFLQIKFFIGSLIDSYIEIVIVWKSCWKTCRILLVEVGFLVTCPVSINVWLVWPKKKESHEKLLSMGQNFIKWNEVLAFFNYVQKKYILIETSSKFFHIFPRYRVLDQVIENTEIYRDSEAALP